MTPYYLFEPEDPRICKHKEWFEMPELTHNDSLALPVSKHSVKNESTIEFAEPLICMQHFPSFMEQFILKTDLKFEKAAGCKQRYYSNYDWISIKAVRWLSNLHKVFPPIPFLLQDKETRFYTLMGDFYIEGKIPSKPLSSNMGRLYLNHRLQMIMTSRLIALSSFFYVFCLGTDYNPIPAIEDVLDSFGIPHDSQYIIRYSEINISEGNPYGLANPNLMNTDFY